MEPLQQGPIETDQIVGLECPSLVCAAEVADGLVSSALSGAGLLIEHETSLSKTLLQSDVSIIVTPASDEESEHLCPGIPHAASSGNVSLVVTDELENRLIIPIEMAGLSTLALIDSGAAESMVHYQWLQQHNIPYEILEKRIIYGFGKNNAVEVAGSMKLQVQINNFKSSPVDFLVLTSDHPITVPFVLAVNYMEVNRLCVSMQAGMLRQLLPSGAVIEYYPSIGEHRCRVICRNVPCHASESVTVFPGEHVRLSVQVPDLQMTNLAHYGLEQDHLLFFDEIAAKRKFQVFSGVMSETESLHVLVAAVGGQPILIKAGEMMGTVSTLIIADPGQGVDVQVANLPGVTEELGNTESKSFIVDDVELGNHLSSKQKEKVIDMLRSHCEAFSCGDMDIGKLGFIEHRIVLWDDTPLYQKPRRLPEPISNEIEKQCQELEFLNIIEPSKSA